MDLLQQYAPQDGESSSDDDALVVSSPQAAAAQPGPRKIVTGTIEHMSISDADFTAAERRFAPHFSTKQTRPPREQPPPPKCATPAPKRPRTPPASPREQLPPPKRATPAPKRPRTPPASPPEKKKAPSPAPFVPTSIEHAAARRDFLGRSWAAPGPAARTFAELETYTPYIPKRCVASLRAHSGGTAAVRFAPPHGHLLLSAGMDGRARVWRTDSAECAREYHGHAKAVRDACFDAGGTRFLTAGFDRSVKLWDVESGRVLGSFKTGGLPYCVRFTPGEGEQKEFLVGCADKKILQIDVRDATSVVQEYDQHMGGVNSISFVEDDRRFVSSADDKVLRVWEYGIPVVIKYVSDPSMHSMPVTVLHPNRKWLACQSMDNQVLVYSARDRFKQNSKKRFKGHLVAGYACGLTFSADGRFIGSGDSLGRLFFWDWKSARMFRTTQAHKGVCIGVEWHPTRPSLVASCGWEGDVKLWD